MNRQRMPDMFPVHGLHVYAVMRCEIYSWQRHKCGMQEIAEQQVDTQFSSIPSLPLVPAQVLPTAPSNPAATNKTAEDIELEKLLAETGMTPA